MLLQDQSQWSPCAPAFCDEAPDSGHCRFPKTGTSIYLSHSHDCSLSCAKPSSLDIFGPFISYGIGIKYPLRRGWAANLLLDFVFHVYVSCLSLFLPVISGLVKLTFKGLTAIDTSTAQSRYSSTANHARKFFFLYYSTHTTQNSPRRLRLSRLTAVATTQNLLLAVSIINWYLPNNSWRSLPRTSTQLPRSCLAGRRLPYGRDKLMDVVDLREESIRKLPVFITTPDKFKGTFRNTGLFV